MMLSQATISTRGDGAGLIDIQAGQLAVIENSTLDNSHSGISPTTGKTQIIAKQLQLNQSTINNYAYSQAKAADITIKVDDLLTLNNGGLIKTESFSDHIMASDINILAGELNIDAQGSLFTAIVSKQN